MTLDRVMRNPSVISAVDICFIAERSPSELTVEVVNRIQAIDECKLYVLCDRLDAMIEQRLIAAGARGILRHPFEASLFASLLSRPQVDRKNESTRATVLSPESDDTTARYLSLWRTFTKILEEASDPGPGFLSEYLDGLRDILGCSHLLLYLADRSHTDRFAFAGASGIAQDQFQDFPLHRTSGLPAVLARRGLAIWPRNDQHPTGDDQLASRELRYFGGDAALPMRGPSALTGILVVGPRICSGWYSEREIVLLVHSLESLARFVGEPHQEDKERARGSVPLRSLPFAAVIVAANLDVIEANDAFHSLFKRATGTVFPGFPTDWQSAISTVAQNHGSSGRVVFDPSPNVGMPRVRLSIGRVEAGPAAPLLVIVEEIRETTDTSADQTELHPLLQRAGVQLSNEFRNALTPIDIMAQLSLKEPGGLVGADHLAKQVGISVHRLRRRIDDLTYLTLSSIIPESLTVEAIVRTTRERLGNIVSADELRRVVWGNEFCESRLTADRNAVALALAELVINGLEAAPGREITFIAEEMPDRITFRVRNTGTWSPPRITQLGQPALFLSDKATGIGIGLEVAKRVAEHHGGKLAVGPVGANTIEAVLHVARSVDQPRRVTVTTLPHVHAKL